MKVTMVLTGHYAGQTVRLGNHQFTNGQRVLDGQPHEIESAIKVLGRSYQAFYAGSDELARAQARDAKAKGHTDGIQHHNEAGEPLSGSERVQGGVDGSAGEIPKAPADVVVISDPDKSAAGQEGMVSDGDGHGHAGLLPETVKRIKDALAAFDPKRDELWTPEGLPTVEAVSAALDNDQSVTRAMIVAIAPAFNREAAQEARDLAAL